MKRLIYAMSTINPQMQRNWAMKAVIYDKAEYIKGDKIYCINCRKVKKLILCISRSEEDNEVQEEYPDI